MKSLKSVVGLAVGVTLFGSLLAGCESDEGKKEAKDPKVSVESKNEAKKEAKTSEKEDKTFKNRLFTTVFDGGEYTLTFEGPKEGDVSNFLLTYKNTLKKDITFKYDENKRVSFILLDGEGDVVAEKDLTVTGEISKSEDVAKGSTFAYPIPVEDVPNGIYTLHLTHFGKSADVKTDLMILPGITFDDKGVTVTNVTKEDAKPKKVTEERPVDKASESAKDEKSEAKSDVTKKSDSTKDSGSKPVTKEQGTSKGTESEDKATETKKPTETEKIPAIKADVVFNGWADSHSVEVMMGDTPAVFQVSEKALPAVEKLQAGDKVSFVFTQNGVTRNVLAVMK